MSGVTYEWKQADFPDKQFLNGLQTDVIAQEIEEIAPELIIEDAEGYKGVSYNRIVPYLIEAVKELRDIVDEKDQQIENLAKCLQELKDYIGI